LTNALGSDSRGHEILAAEVLRSKGAAAPEDPLIRLATRGPNQLPVINPVHRGATGRAAALRAPVSADEVSRFQQTLGLSRNQTRTATQFMRSWMGRDSFEAGVTLQLESRDKTLDEYFDVTELQMQVSKDAAGQRRVVFCKDVERLLRSVAEQRQVDLDDCMVKVGMDGGGSFLKVFAKSDFKICLGRRCCCERIWRPFDEEVRETIGNQL
jgi:hypothetical protein